MGLASESSITDLMAAFQDAFSRKFIDSLPRRSTAASTTIAVGRRVRFGRGRPSAQLPLVVAFAKRHAPRAQDVIGGYGVEMKVGQQKGKKESLRRESELSRRPGRGAIIFVERAVEGNVQHLAGPAIDLGGRERLQRRYRVV